MFIDEIDTVEDNGLRDWGWPGEREQTLNQLLVEMDSSAPGRGDSGRTTNRPDVLGPALQAGAVLIGRFRSIPLMSKGRGKSCGCITRNVVLDKSVDLKVLAPGLDFRERIWPIR
ncbi:MAG: hypothetical protein IPI28_07305 [Candidatus Omnitrophica bacterium]|nr:hypothetical protein [Candidatus Omnitrophota bacterium]